MRPTEGNTGSSAQASGTPVKPSAKLQTELLELSAWVPAAMGPGCLFLLHNRLQLRKEHGPHSFWAVLACPQCGTLGLITQSQYEGEHSVICGSELCSCHLFIHERSRFEYVPAH
jgi:hypothetical protein